MRAGVALLGLCLVMPSVASSGEKSPREQYEALNALRADPSAVYEVTSVDRIELRRADVQFSFEQGKLSLLNAIQRPCHRRRLRRARTRPSRAS